MSGILLITEQNAGSWHRMSFEALGAALQLGTALNLPVHACILGSNVGPLAAEISAYPLAAVIALESGALAEYTADGATSALAWLVDQLQPDYVIAPHTYRARDFAPRLAARFGRSLLADVTGMRLDGPSPVFQRQLFQGKLTADYAFDSPAPNFVSVQAGSFRAVEPAAAGAPVESKTPPAAEIRQKPEPAFQEQGRAVDLTAAERIVAVGRGIREEGNLVLAQELAQALGAELGASRPICDNGWLPMERQVGSSGQTVAPKLYVAVGISGAIQHVVGMKGAACIVAINKDPAAPIFEIADYGIVADLFDAVPALTAALQSS
ncbi:MAG: electron transfer flavoprotein subunit alpha/FixB family protein [Acidobacteria bacterium]|nr:electron transfer flavoprotein subunit alpha/FixB family protein [Acidobacteriota bacterium]